MTSTTPSLHHLRLLGGFELASPSGHTVPLSSRKAQVMIAYLAQRAGQSVSRNKLATMLWSETSEAESRHSLRQCLLILRRVIAPLDDVLVVDQDSVRLRPERVEVDVQRLERLAESPREESLREAALLYRGEFLEGIDLRGEPIGDWVIFERRRLAHLVKKSLLPFLESSESSESTGRMKDATQIATRLLAIDPQQPDVQSTLVRLYGGAKALPAGGRRIAVADPDEQDRRRIVDALRSRGHEVIECADGAELLLETGSREPDAVVVDLALPEIGPLPIIRAMAAKRPRVPVLCTGEPRQEEKEAEGLAAGAADFVRKPVDAEVLLLRIENAIRQRNPKTSDANG